jgi:hypothetical protein
MCACRQSGSLDTPHVFVGFAGYKYRPGVGLTPTLENAFNPVSTSFQVVTAQSSAGAGGSEFAYANVVTNCKAVCGVDFDTFDPDENYVGVSIAATPLNVTREKLNLPDILAAR